MKTYINRSTGELFAYEPDGSQDAYIPAGLELLSDEELAVIRTAQEAAAAPTPEQVMQAAFNKRDGLLAAAAIRIGPLQDAVDLGEVSAGEEQSLLAWKRYRIAVNRISQQSGFPTDIDWPSQPD